MAYTRDLNEDLVWNADTQQYVPAVQRYVLTVTPSPNDSTVKLEAMGYTTVTGTGSQYIEVDSGTSVTYTVERDGYVTQTGSIVVNATQTVNITLLLSVDLTVNPTPGDATVTLSATGYTPVSGEGTQTITVATGTTVEYVVTKFGYTESRSSVVLTTDQTIDVTVLKLVTFGVNPAPASATVTLSATGYTPVSGEGQQSITVATGTTVNYNVSATGYLTQTGSYVVGLNDEVLPINLLIAQCTLTINPTPSNATVTLTAPGYTTVTGTGSQSITVVNGTTVTYTVERTGYVTQTGTTVLSTATKTLSVELFEKCSLTIVPTPSDAVIKLTPAGGTEQTGPSILVNPGTSVTYNVSKTGYITKSGTTVVSSNTSLNIVLVSQSSSMVDLNVNPDGSPKVLYGDKYIDTDVIALMQNKVDVLQGTAHAGKILAVDIDGYVKLSQGVPGLTVNWGEISGTLSNQADLQNALNNKANDTSIVHKTGNEAISGTKTFADAITVRTNLTPSTNTTKSVTVEDTIVETSKNTDSVIDGMSVVRAQPTDGSREVWYRAGFKNSSNTANLWPAVIVGVAANDTTYIKTNVSSMPASEDSMKLATTEWVNRADSVVHKTGNETISGTKTFVNGIAGTATSALWADLAEQYLTDEDYEIGTLIKFGGDKDITIADTEVNGVISEKPGFLLDYGLDDSLPVALAGKTPVRVIGKVKKFDRITLSEIPGVGRVAKDNEKVIARALESSDVEEEKLVKCVTKFTL